MGAGAALGLALSRSRAAAAGTPPGLTVMERSAWGAGLAPTGPLEAEAREDVRFLLVHHTASTNDYAPGDVPGVLQGFFRFHTTDRGWPDVAYNFFVDRYGGVWEGRAGSLAAPIKGDATGGSQGFAMLCTFIGDHSDVAPTPEAEGAMVGLLAWLAQTYGIDTSPGSTTTFVSRGSNRWPAGAPVTAATISGHRDMSQTECPGDAGYARVTDVLPAAVTSRRDELASTVPEPTTTTAAPTTTGAPATTSATDGTGSAAPPAGGGDDGGWPDVAPAVGLGAGLLAAAVAGVIAIRRRARG